MSTKETFIFPNKLIDIHVYAREIVHALKREREKETEYFNLRVFIKE